METIIRYAEITDYSWLKEHNRHISEKVLRIKIDNRLVRQPGCLSRTFSPTQVSQNAPRFAVFKRLLFKNFSF
jgi:hypothetical protein